MYLLKIVNFNDLLLISIEQMHLCADLLPLLLCSLRLLLFFNLQLLQKLGLVLSFELVVTVPDIFSLLVIDEDIVEVSEVGKVGNKMSLVLFVAFSLADREGIAENVEHLQVLEFCLFV